MSSSLIFPWTHDHDHVAIDDAACGSLDGRHILQDLDHPVKKFATVLRSTQVSTTKHDGHLHLVAVSKEAACVIQFRLQVVLVDVGTKLDLLDGKTRLFLASFPGLLIFLETVFAPVHDPHDDGAYVRRDLHQVEPLVQGYTPGFVERDDARLFTIGIDESDGAETDLLVDSDVMIDERVPS